MHPQRNNVLLENEKTKRKRKERITNNFIDYKKETIFSPIFFTTLFKFQTKAESFHKILKRRINYTSYNSGDIVSNTIKYHHGPIKKTGTQAVVNKGGSMINELSRGPISTRLKRSSLLLAVDACVIHALLCIRDIASSGYYAFYRDESGSFTRGILFDLCRFKMREEIRELKEMR